MKDRLFFPDVPHHCYQRTVDHGVLFYTDIDHLMFFTLFCTMAARHQMRVLKLVQMPDHFHHSCIARSRRQFTDFARDFSALLTREYNRAYSRSGSLLETPFSSAPKRGDKAIRTNLIYLDNNPVERKLVTHAEDYRWNYLAYGASEHPFSEKDCTPEGFHAASARIKSSNLSSWQQAILEHPCTPKFVWVLVE